MWHLILDICNLVFVWTLFLLIGGLLMIIVWALFMLHWATLFISIPCYISFMAMIFELTVDIRSEF